MGIWEYVSLDYLAMLLPILGFLSSIGGSYQKSDSSSQSNSGFAGFDKNAASKYSANRLFEVGNRAYGELQQDIPQFNMSQEIPGLFQEQEGAANAFAKKMFANASAGGALRGQFSMNNTPGLVGSAITNMGATLLPMISDNLKTSFMMPEQIRAQRYANVMTPLQALVSGLGSSATSQASSLGVSGSMGFGGAPAPSTPLMGGRTT